MTRIRDLDCSVRLQRRAEMLGYETLADFCRHTEAELLALPNFGPISLRELLRHLDTDGLRLRRMQDPPMVRVRVAVAMAADGTWSAYGSSLGGDASAQSMALRDLFGHTSQPTTMQYVQCWVPLPESPKNLSGKVVEAES